MAAGCRKHANPTGMLLGATTLIAVIGEILHPGAWKLPWMTIAVTESYETEHPARLESQRQRPPIVRQLEAVGEFGFAVYRASGG